MNFQRELDSCFLNLHGVPDWEKDLNTPNTTLESMTSKILKELDTMEKSVSKIQEETDIIDALRDEAQLVIPKEIPIALKSSSRPVRGEALQLFGDTVNSLTLGYTVDHSVTKDTKMTIKIEGGLLIGDTRRLNNYDGCPFFVGVSNPSADLFDLFDSSGVIFESYEPFDRNFLSFVYKEGVALFKRGYQSVRISMNFDEPVNANAVHLISFEDGILDVLKIVNKYKEETILLSAEQLDSNPLVFFSTEELKEIQMILSQPIPWVTPYGLFANDNSLGRVIYGTKRSLGSLSRGIQTAPLDIDSFQLFEAPKDTVLVPIMTNRYGIHLKEFFCGHIRFKSKGEWICEELNIPAETSRILFKAKGLFPEPDCIQASISVDSGKQWHSVSIDGISTGQYSSILINPQRENIHGNHIVLHGDDIRFLLKISMQTNDVSVSPILTDLYLDLEVTE